MMQELVSSANNLCFLINKAQACTLSEKERIQIENHIETIQQLAHQCKILGAPICNFNSTTRIDSQSNGHQHIHTASSDGLNLRTSVRRTTKPLFNMETSVFTDSCKPATWCGNQVPSSSYNISCHSTRELTSSLDIREPCGMDFMAEFEGHFSSKVCASCKKATTTQWRSGSDGKANLCNACGLRFRRKKNKSRRSRSHKQWYRDEINSPSLTSTPPIGSHTTPTLSACTDSTNCSDNIQKRTAIEKTSPSSYRSTINYILN